MGNGGLGCTPVLAAPGCTPSLPPAPCTPSLSGRKPQECFDPCTPSLGGRSLEPLGDQECADIALVQATVRGEVTDVVRALSLGASPNTIAELTLRMGEPKKGRRGRAAHMTPLMRACELGHEDVVLHLIKARASTIQCDSHGWTPLCHALAAGEVAIARLICQQPNCKLERQKEICEKLHAEIIHKCQRDASLEVLAAVEMEFATGGLLDLGANPVEVKPDMPVGADSDKIHPIFHDDAKTQDLLSGAYSYPECVPSM